MMQVGSPSGSQKQTAATVLGGFHAQSPEGQLLGLLLRPIAGLVLWWLPLGLDPTMHKAFAIELVASFRSCRSCSKIG